MFITLTQIPMGLSPTQVQVGSRFILVDLNINMCPTRWTQTQVKMSRTDTKGVRPVEL